MFSGQSDGPKEMVVFPHKGESANASAITTGQPAAGEQDGSALRALIASISERARWRWMPSLSRVVTCEKARRHRDADVCSPP